MKVLIIGSAGFVGQHLQKYLLKQSADVLGVDLSTSPRCDILDPTSIQKALTEIKPDTIFHLAAQSNVPESFKNPARTFEVNVIGTINLFESIKEIRINPVILVAGSAEVYGRVEKLPISEENPLKPENPYAASKAAQDLVSFQYFKNYGLKIIRTRSFNHAGPGQSEAFVVSAFAKQIAEIEKDLKESIISVGNLEAKRDFTDVRDVVEAYALAVEKCEPGEVYNIASGRAYAISEVLEKLLSFSKVKIKIKPDPARMRPSDIPIIIGDSTKFRKKTGWQPKIPFEKTLEDTLSWWRSKI